MGHGDTIINLEDRQSNHRTSSRNPSPGDPICFFLIRSTLKTYTYAPKFHAATSVTLLLEHGPGNPRRGRSHVRFLVPKFHLCALSLRVLRTRSRTTHPTARSQLALGPETSFPGTTLPERQVLLLRRATHRAFAAKNGIVRIDLAE